MTHPTLTIFANFRINDEERLIRLKDSFYSFKDIGAEKWVINIRGKLKNKTKFFLENELKDKAIITFYDSGKGWFNDSRLLAKNINSDFVMIWIEDHKNMVKIDKYKEIIKQMQISNSDYMNYTWWFLGKVYKMYSNIDKEDFGDIETFDLTPNVNQKLRLENRKPYIISLPSFYSKKLFFKILKKNDPKLRRWPKETPFDFEKKHHDTNWLPLRMSISKYELFACLDDDNSIDGYSLQSRGLYPRREIRKVALKSKKSFLIRCIILFIPKKVLNILKRITYHF
jgi:hypothetical protein